jgi:hypothetical protein
MDDIMLLGAVVLAVATLMMALAFKECAARLDQLIEYTETEVTR